MNNDLKKMIEASHSLKRKHSMSHIGRNLTDAEWTFVMEKRVIRAAKKFERYNQRLANRGPLIVPAYKRLAQRRILAKQSSENKLDKIIRDTLMKAARIARSEGFEIRRSTDRSGRVSSYYAKRKNMRPIRISDHELPMTDIRTNKRIMNGGGSPFQGEIIIDKDLSPTRIRRMIVLAEAGRL